MNIASPNLCKELFGLSHWTKAYACWRNGKAEVATARLYDGNCFPAYDLGFLMRALPPFKFLDTSLYRLTVMAEEEEVPSFTAAYASIKKTEEGTHNITVYHTEVAPTPEDALCRLAITLFKKGFFK